MATPTKWQQHDVEEKIRALLSKQEYKGDSGHHFIRPDVSKQ
jgi:hypothetical protein